MRLVKKLSGAAAVTCVLAWIIPVGAMPQPTSAEVSQLVAGDGDYFFYSLQVESDLAVVGMPRDDVRGVDSGSVHFFRQQAGQWVHDGQLVLADGSPKDCFGASVALRGDTLMVGAPGCGGSDDSQGSVFIFVRAGTAWVQRQRIDAGGQDGMAHFGAWVELGEGGALVGAMNAGAVRDQDKPVAFVFLRTGESWTRQGWLQGVTTIEDSRGAVLGRLHPEAPHAKYVGRAVEVNLKGGAPLAKPDFDGCLVEAVHRGLWIEQSAGERTFVPYSRLRLLYIGGPCQRQP